MEILFNRDEVAALQLSHAIGISLMTGMIAAYDSGTRLSADQLMIGGKGKNRERLVGELIR